MLAPTADNTLYENAGGALSNGAGEFFFVGQAASRAGIRRGVLKFDVASAIPAGAHIDSVTLSLHMSKTISSARDIALHRLTSDWGEGTSNAGGQEGEGTTSTTNSATWVHRFYSGTNWTQVGGDFVSTASATQSVNGNGSYDWTGAGLVADVQRWLDTANSQFGWLVKEVGESAEGTAKRFDSRENANSTFRPKLTIQYTAGNQAPTVAHPLTTQFTVTGQAFNYTVPADTFQDDGATLTYSARRQDGSTLPSWLSFNAATRTFSGTPQVGDATLLKLSVVASDAGQPPLSVNSNFTLIVARSTAPWQNPVEPLDVDFDGFVAPVDALLIINRLNSPIIPLGTHNELPTIAPGGPQPPPLVDADGDGFLAPHDVLRIINRLNGATGEGEAREDAVVDASVNAPPVVDLPAIEFAFDAEVDGLDVIACELASDARLLAAHHREQVVDHANRRRSDQHDEDAWEDEQHEREDQLHRRLRRAFFSQLATSRAHRVALDA